MAEVFLDEAHLSNGFHHEEKSGKSLSRVLDQELTEWIHESPLNSHQKTLLKEKLAEHMILELETLKCLENTHITILGLPVGVHATFEKHFLKWKKEVLTKESTKDITPTGQVGVENEVKYFEASEQTIENRCGEEETIITVKVINKELKDALKSFIRSGVLYEETPQISAIELLQHLPNFKSSSVECLKILGVFLEKQFEEITTKVNKMIEEGVIEYSALWYTFQKGTKVYSWEGTELVGTTITTSRYIRSSWSPHFRIDGEVVKTDGSKYFLTNENWTIPAFNGTMKLTELPVRLMTDEIQEKLTQRGKIFRSVGLGHHYMSYRGSILWRTWCGCNQYKATCRVMVDAVSFSRLNPNYDTFNSSNRCNDVDLEGLPDENLFMTFPTVPGFSFAAKKWGEILVEKLSPIIFDSLAYDRLVLPAEKKSLVKALVLNNNEKCFSDIISGKGCGCIFLLHGPPGVGKTLTAEAIAELLEKPLYSVSVGELGTNTTELENKLREILEVAGTWKAVILIDEADIFLEKRNESDIIRNAMVGIFLRLLEYHQGVLFLTTNRVKSFDSAFHSRISVALKYEELDNSARAQVWATFLEAAEIPFTREKSDNKENLNIHSLAEYALNGRQIRTTVRLAQALAQQENIPVGPQHIEVTVKIANQFQHDLLEKD